MRARKQEKRCRRPGCRKVVGRKLRRLGVRDCNYHDTDHGD